MPKREFRALVVEEIGDNKFLRKIDVKNTDDLPDGDVLVKVAYSSLNYKDALSAIGNRGVTKKYPHTPGIDAAGIVEESKTEDFKPGDEVIVTSYDLGMDTPGGFGQYIRVPASWVVRLPSGLTLKESMIFGTAGFTAAMSVYNLSQVIKPEDGPVLVTGATGGVGSLAVAILAKIGYKVHGATGKTSQKNFLKKLGAKKILSRDDVSDKSGKPMLKGIWAGAVDTVGGDILATTIKSTRLHGVVTCCGLVASTDLPLNIFPFIIRGIRLIGIGSQNCPMDLRKKLWEKLSSIWKIDHLDMISKEIGLDDLNGNIDLILKGKQRGRVVVNLNI